MRRSEIWDFGKCYHVLWFLIECNKKRVKSDEPSSPCWIPLLARCNRNKSRELFNISFMTFYIDFDSFLGYSSSIVFHFPNSFIIIYRSNLFSSKPFNFWVMSSTLVWIEPLSRMLRNQQKKAFFFFSIWYVNDAGKMSTKQQ